MIDPVASIEAHDAGRDPRRLRIKYEKMAADAFSFFRGTCHLFVERLPLSGPLVSAPAAWICGDLHFENFGSFHGESGLVYFDLNDFDESCLAPATWDPVRFQASLVLGADAIDVSSKRAERLAREFLDEYAATLADGRARWIDRDGAEGLVKDLLDDVRGREPKELLDRRAPKRGGERRIRVDEDDPPDADAKAIPTSAARASRVRKAVAAFARTSDRARGLRVLDVADRVAGTGSLGVDRYAILLRGDGGKDDYELFDAKAAPPSAPAARSPFDQPTWASEADRIVACQRRLQAVSPAFLAAVCGTEVSYVVRELLPSEDRVDLAKRDGKEKRLEKAVRDMARIVGWAHLRASGRQASATADELIAFGRDASWRERLTAIALDAADAARRDHAAFRSAWKARRVRLPPAWD